jgi:hypothetical protein
MKRKIFIFSALIAFLFALAMPTRAGSPNGVAGLMPAFYDGVLFNINFKELPTGGEASTLNHNKSINTIYMSDQFMDLTGHMFISVIDAIQGDGFNPLWNEVQIVFPNASAARQFTSDTDILAAADAHQIQLVPTNEVYRCSVIGKNHAK